MVVDILFSILILFIGISGSKKGFLDEISEFIGIGLAIWLVMSFYAVSYTHLTLPTKRIV